MADSQWIYGRSLGAVQQGKPLHKMTAFDIVNYSFAIRKWPHHPHKSKALSSES